MRSVKFSIHTFGCRVNHADSLALESALSARGAVASDPSEADLLIVNTCTVTGAADQGARQLIRRLHRANQHARIVVTGCYATRAPEATRDLPGVDRLVSNEDKDGLASTVLSALDGDGTASAATCVDHVAPEPGVMGRTAYTVRVQTGCDERCAFCIVPATRGRSRSRPAATVLSQIERLGRAGFKEIWLVGVHLGSYGRDLDPRCSLLDLLRELDRLPGDLMFRMGSIEPMDCPAALVELVARSGRFAPHCHLPLQHASDSVLRAMRRPYEFGRYRDLASTIRGLMPHASIGADVIAGFPGETAAQFEESATRIASLPLSYLHVFPYSDRPGTDSSQMTPKVRDIEIQARAEALRTIGRVQAATFAGDQVGSVRPGLTLQGGTVVLTDNYLKVRIPPGHSRNERVRVRIDSVSPDIAGTVV